MVSIEEIIRNKALVRLSSIFSVPVKILDGDMLITKIKEPRKISLLKRNEYDIVADDIRDVASTRILKLINNGDLTIITVDDYVNHMISCYKEVPRLVNNLLGDTNVGDSS